VKIILDLKHDLNAEQAQAVLHNNGPCCTVAGAGSGKTRVITYRAARLVEAGVPGKNILAVTFTKKAAVEMQKRMAGLIGTAALENLTVGTFHSICYRILQSKWRDDGKNRLDPAGESWCHWTIKDILDGMRWSLDISTAQSFISWQKSNLITVSDRLDMRNADPALEDKFRELYTQYEAVKNKENKLDFDDMLLWSYQLLRNNSSVRLRYQEKFRHIMVDEFQDTNQAQFEILRLLAARNNVFAVGDARQAIYGWRAARIEFILNFEKLWPGARIIHLKTNYRSTQNIVEASNNLISLGSISYPGKCRSYHGSGLDPIDHYSDDENGEADYVCHEIEELCRDGLNYRNFACLYRVNAQSRGLEDSLIKNQIPYTIIGADSFYNQKEVKDIIAYLRILTNPDDDEAITRMINIPTRYLGKVFIQAAKNHALSHRMSLCEALGKCPEAGLRKYRGVHDFVRCIEKLKRLDCSPADMTIHVRKVTGYDQWLAKTEGGDSADNHRLENLTALAASAARFSKLEDFLFYVEQAQVRPVDPDTGGDQVQLMTLHRSKGLEFPVVFLCGLNQGLLPHQKSCVYINDELVPESIEEERRLCYVGMTRAQKRLYLSSIGEYQGRKIKRSVFLTEIMSASQHQLAMAR
jgi:DNA helicase-2/ATP-dependent DNA helicase PcrA